MIRPMGFASIATGGDERAFKISASPNRPMMTGISPTPSMSTGMSKVNRCTPWMGSMPTMAIK